MQGQNDSVIHMRKAMANLHLCQRHPERLQGVPFTHQSEFELNDESEPQFAFKLSGNRKRSHGGKVVSLLNDDWPRLILLRHEVYSSCQKVSTAEDTKLQRLGVVRASRPAIRI